MYVGAKMTDSFINSCIFLVTKAVGMAVKIDDIEPYQKELRKDYIINKELSNLGGKPSLMYALGFATAKAVFITAKHVDVNALVASGDAKVWDGQPVTHPSHDPEGYSLEGQDEVQDEVPELTT